MLPSAVELDQWMNPETGSPVDASEPAPCNPAEYASGKGVTPAKSLADVSVVDEGTYGEGVTPEKRADPVKGIGAPSRKSNEAKRRSGSASEETKQGQSVAKRQRIQGAFKAHASYVKKADRVAEDPPKSTLAELCKVKNTAELIAKLVQEIAVALTRWHLLLRKRTKDGLATGAVNLASHYARVLALFRPGDMAQELQVNAEMLAIVAFAIHKLVQLAASLGAKTNGSTTPSCHYFLRLSGDGLVQVEHLCHTIVSTSVDLLALVWPQGFSDFSRIEDMPKPPRPSIAGGLHRALCKDAHLRTYGGELNRRLMQAIDQGTDSLILCCACTSVDAVLEAVKQRTEDQRLPVEDASSRAQTCTSVDAVLQAVKQRTEHQRLPVEDASLHGSQVHPCNVETVDVEVQEGGSPPPDDVAPVQPLQQPQLSEDVSKPRAQKWVATEDGGWRKCDETTDLAEERGSTEASMPNDAQCDEEDLPLSETLSQPLEDPMDEENQTLASLS